MAKVIIEVIGGVVQNVYSDDKTVEVEVVDFDNAESKEHYQDMQEDIDRAEAEGMVQIY